MTIAIRVALALALASAAAPAALAAQPDTARARNDSIVPERESVQAPEPSPARLALADSLLRVMHVDTMLHASMKVGYEMMVRQQPALGMYRDVFDQWATKYLTWAEFGPPFKRLYAEEFTDDELRSLIAFYATPAGQKAASKQAELTQRGGDIGRAIAEKYASQFQDMIRARLATPADTTH